MKQASISKNSTSSMYKKHFYWERTWSLTSGFPEKKHARMDLLFKNYKSKHTSLICRHGRSCTPISLCDKRTRTITNRFKIFNAEGGELLLSAPPEKAYFYYLTLNLSKEVVVICSFAVQQNGWYDWFYSFDMVHNTLSRSGPAY